MSEERENLEQAIREGHQANRILADPFFQAKREEILAGLRERMEEGNPLDTEYLAACRLMLDTSKAFFELFEVLAENGAEAEKELEQSIEAVKQLRPAALR